MTPLRLAVVGLGVIARYYLRAIERAPGVRLAAVCDVRDEALAPFRGRVACHGDHRTLLRDEPLDALVVTVPNDVHASVCGDAVRAGVAVCVEKPLATTLADGQALVAAARASGATLFTAFHRRYNSGVRELLDATASAAAIRSLTVRYLERIEDHVGDDRWYLDPARCGGGCVADNGPNAFDLAATFVGELELCGAAIERDAMGTDRRANIALRGATGAAARVLLDWSFDGECKDVRIELADGAVHTVDMLAGYPEFKSSLRHEYDGILDDFCRTLRAPRPPAADPGLAALRLVDEVYRRELAGKARA